MKAHIKEVDRGYSYDIGSKSDKVRQAGKIYIKRTDTGLAYEVIGGNNKLKSGIISWHTIPWMPRNENQIIRDKEYVLPILLMEMHKQHVTPLARYPHFEQMEHINWEIKYLIDYIQEKKKQHEKLPPEIREKIHKGMQNIANMLADYSLAQPYESTDSFAPSAFWDITSK